MKTYRLLSIVAVCAALVSCGNDWLDLEPSTYVESSTSIQLVSEARYALNSVYNTMSDPYAYSGRLVYYADVTADDMQAASATKRTGNYYRFNFSKDTAPSSHWYYLYNMIANCNIVLSKIDGLPVQNEAESAERSQLKGEALCLRALAYFDLCRIYAYPYNKDGGASWGVPIVTDAPDVDNKPTRSSVAKCYGQIITDLTTGIELIGEDFQKGHINKWGALTLLSRVYLYKNDNANALQAAKDAITGAQKKKYALWTNAEYPTAWANDSNASKPGEVLLEIVNLTTDSPGKEAMGYLNSPKGYSDQILTVSFYHLLKEDPNDVRVQLINIGSKRAYINKFQPQEGEVIQDANIPLIRLSEAYLNAAEAAFKLEDYATAVQYLNPIVKRANPAKSVTEADLSLDRILTERRKELVGEGHRLYDLMRNGLPVHRISETDKTISSTKHISDYMDFDWNFYKIVLPIPKAEMDANPNLREQQNPGY